MELVFTRKMPRLLELAQLTPGKVYRRYDESAGANTPRDHYYIAAGGSGVVNTLVNLKNGVILSANVMQELRYEEVQAAVSIGEAVQ